MAARAFGCGSSQRGSTSHVSAHCTAMHAGLDCCNICYCQQRRAIVKEAKERARCTGTLDAPSSCSALTSTATTSFVAPRVPCAPRASKEAARSLFRGTLVRGLESSSCSSGDHFSPRQMAAQFSLARPSSEDVKVEPVACSAEAPLSPQHAKLVRPLAAVMTIASLPKLTFCLVPRAAGWLPTIRKTLAQHKSGKGSRQTFGTSSTLCLGSQTPANVCILSVVCPYVFWKCSYFVSQGCLHRRGRITHSTITCSQRISEAVNCWLFVLDNTFKRCKETLRILYVV
jgi:hypothetical protein